MPENPEMRVTPFAALSLDLLFAFSWAHKLFCAYCI